ncbi:MAG: YqhA family protein [Treponema sp.]|nr:YqhA family protein [Treponema sp.]
MKKLSKKTENIFETALFNSRFITLTAVVGSLISAVIMFIKSTLQVINGLGIFMSKLQTFSILDQENNYLVALLVSSVDGYLFATILLIFSMGIYELFISKIDPAIRPQESRPNWLKITSIDDLKSSLGKVILMVLIVAFFEHSLSIEYKTALDLLYLGLGVLFISIALYLTHATYRGKQE